LAGVGLAAGFPGVVPAGFAPLDVGGWLVAVVPDCEPVLAGVVDAGVAGSEVSGVGTSGTGLERTLESNSFKPASDLFRYLYSSVSASIIGFLSAAVVVSAANRA